MPDASATRIWLTVVGWRSWIRKVRPSGSSAGPITHSVSGSPSNAFAGRFHGSEPSIERGLPDSEMLDASGYQAVDWVAGSGNSDWVGRSSAWPSDRT